MSAVTSTDFADLKLVSRGKVRDVYATSDPDALLFVATDRISAFDVVLKNVRLGIGAGLQQLQRLPRSLLALLYALDSLVLGDIRQRQSPNRTLPLLV